MRTKQVVDFLKDMAVFAIVVESESFTKAAGKLDMTPSATSRYVSRLEKKLGQHLIVRDTRNFKTTEAGQLIYLQSMEIIKSAQVCLNISEQLLERPAGKITLSAPKAFAKWVLSPVILLFLKKYPDIKIQLLISDEIMDVHDGLDLIIQISEKPNFKLISVPLMSVDHIVCASRDYINTFGQPEHPSELIHHKCLSLGNKPTEVNWVFMHKTHKETAHIKVDTRYEINHSEARLAGILSGLGIGYVPFFVAQEELNNKNIISLFEEWRIIAPFQGTAWLMYDRNPYMPIKLRLFIDFLRKSISSAWG